MTFAMCVFSVVLQYLTLLELLSGFSFDGKKETSLHYPFLGTLETLETGYSSCYGFFFTLSFLLHIPYFSSVLVSQSIVQYSVIFEESLNFDCDTCLSFFLAISLCSMPKFC